MHLVSRHRILGGWRDGTPVLAAHDPECRIDDLRLVWTPLESESRIHLKPVGHYDTVGNDYLRADLAGFRILLGPLPRRPDDDPELYDEGLKAALGADDARAAGRALAAYLGEAAWDHGVESARWTAWGEDPFGAIELRGAAGPARRGERPATRARAKAATWI